jgi:hypothetical protein
MLEINGTAREIGQSAANQSISNISVIEMQVGSSETKRENNNPNCGLRPRALPPLPIHKPDRRFPNNDHDMGHYLAGLIDGDGYISKDTNKSSIVIAFHIKDVSLAYSIKTHLNFGAVNLYPKTNSATFVLTSREGLNKLIKLIHGKLRIPHKVERLNALVATSSSSLNLPPAPICVEGLKSSYYLAGLIDSDGSLSIRLIYRPKREK